VFYKPEYFNGGNLVLRISYDKTWLPWFYQCRQKRVIYLLNVLLVGLTKNFTCSNNKKFGCIKLRLKNAIIKKFLFFCRFTIKVIKSQKYFTFTIKSFQQENTKTQEHMVFKFSFKINCMYLNLAVSFIFILGQFHTMCVTITNVTIKKVAVQFWSYFHIIKNN
jgi:hypothetical protein